jgi:hypothetical protein
MLPPSQSRPKKPVEKQPTLHQPLTSEPRSARNASVSGGPLGAAETLEPDDEQAREVTVLQIDEVRSGRTDRPRRRAPPALAVGVSDLLSFDAGAFRAVQKREIHCLHAVRRW